MRLQHLLLISGLSIALLAGCDGNDDANDLASGEASPSASQTESASAIVEPEPSPSASPSATTVAPSPSSSPDDPLGRYVAAIPGEFGSDDIVFSAEADLDLDGQAETVLAVGSTGEGGEVKGLYVLRDVGGEVMRIGDNLAADAYMTNEAKLVTLQGEPKPIIYAGLTNGAELQGFQLYRMDGGKPEKLAYAASATGAGSDGLVDRDADGRFDGYVQHRYSYDTLYYDVERRFEWKPEQGAFAPYDTDVALEEPYPVDIEEVVYQFLSLGAIDDGYSAELTARLNELSSVADATEQSIDWDLWRIALFDAAMEIGGSYSVDVKEKGDSATARVVGRTETKSDDITFELAKKSGRWKIVSME
ncbi:hypothetical protein [Cohnella sp. GCM10027633]|uniref:hypothetical protein n=1 Tax=unclassified Cohnella TaxID=2636738 RepID=UPI003634B675